LHAAALEVIPEGDMCEQGLGTPAIVKGLLFHFRQLEKGQCAQKAFKRFPKPLGMLLWRSDVRCTTHSHFSGKWLEGADLLLASMRRRVPESGM
jgi:hypothetical protein